ncbi:MAG: cytochrome b [Hyphomicrobiales bacterium]|nr:MAG: cytochrome b [Hyphomicrobiales bacterium]
MAAPNGYSRLQIVLHWTIAALVVFQLAINEDVRAAFRDRLRAEEGMLDPLALLHIVVGLAVLVLALLRLSVRLLRGAPEIDKIVPAPLKWLAHLTHILLYSFIIGVPVTGAIAWFGHAEWSAELHEIGRLLLIPAIGVHILGALVEHFVFRNDSLKRMFKATAD